jgi:hypothetical protein
VTAAYGYGSGSGYGYGYGDGYGDGYGYGDGDGYGYGDGDGDGYGDGYGEVLGEVGEHKACLVWPGYIRVGCQTLSVRAWKAQWRALAAKHGVVVTEPSVRQMLKLARP